MSTGVARIAAEAIARRTCHRRRSPANEAGGRTGGAAGAGAAAGTWLSRVTIATASARLDAPSFRSAFARCQFTVLSLMDS